MNGVNLCTCAVKGHSGRWNCTLCSEWGMKANVSVSWHDSVEYKWYCHWVLQQVSREFHSSELHYLDRPEGIVSEWVEGKREVVSIKQKPLQNYWLQALEIGAVLQFTMLKCFKVLVQICVWFVSSPDMWFGWIWAPTPPVSFNEHCRYLSVREIWFQTRRPLYCAFNNASGFDFDCWA